MLSYDELKPWGRNLDEYRRMFALDGDLDQRILGCGDGPASFNQELTARGGTVTSIDPIYRFTRAQIAERIAASYDDVVSQTRAHQDKFVWTTISSVEELARRRMAAMQRFLDDYEAGLGAGRYVPAELPTLPFPDGAFDLAVCSHALFLYSDLLDEDFHFDSIVEMCRVASEARVFPLLDYNGVRSFHLDPVRERLYEAGLTASVERVEYEFQRGGNEMLRVRARRSRD